MISDLSQLLSKLSILPIYREIALEVIRRDRESRSDISGFLKLISSDPILSIQILKIANASLFNNSKKICSLEKALVVLGFELVKDIAISLSTSTVFKAQLDRKHIQYIWSHSLVTALSLKILAENFNSENKELLYFGGLLHDVGKIIMMLNLGEEYYLLLEKHSQEGLPLTDLERKYLGNSHEEIGAQLATLWNLPSTVVCMIEAHHGVSHKSSGDNQAFLNHLVYLGNLIAHGLEKDITDLKRLSELYPASKEYLTISDNEYKHIRDMVRREIRNQQTFLNHIQIGIS